MNNAITHSQELVDRSKKRLEELKNTLDGQRDMLSGLCKLAEELVPNYANSSLPENMTAEQQKQYNDVLHEINEINNTLSANAPKVSATAKLRKNMV